MRTPVRGFTLIETLVVSAIVGILLAVAIPGFSSFISKYRATSAVNDMLQAVVLARGEALKQGRKVTLAPIGGDWRQGWVVFLDSNANGAYDSLTEKPIFQHNVLPSSITVAPAGNATLPFGGNVVIFDGTGYPRTLTGGALTGGIVITDQIGSNTRNIRTLCLASYGRPRIVQATDACAP